MVLTGRRPHATCDMFAFMIRTITMCLLAAAVSGAADLATRKALTLTNNKEIAAAAEAEAVKNKWNVVIVILDEGANPLYLQRMDTVQIASVDVAIHKATSAVKFKRPTKVFEEQLTGGRQAILRLIRFSRSYLPNILRSVGQRFTTR